MGYSSLKSRKRRLSQISFAEESIFYKSYDNSKHAKNIEFIVVDSSLPMSSYIQKVILCS